MFSHHTAVTEFLLWLLFISLDICVVCLGCVFGVKDFAGGLAPLVVQKAFFLQSCSSVPSCFSGSSMALLGEGRDSGGWSICISDLNALSLCLLFSLFPLCF